MSDKGKYPYLHKYIDKERRIPGNRFIPLDKKDIYNAEKSLGYKFSPALREFFLELGYGFFKNKSNSNEVEIGFPNRLMDPGSIADIVLEGLASGQLHPEAEFEEGDMPFFEIGEGRDFLVMRPLSDKPNAVYDMGGGLIEENFERFIWRLYYESPTYYLDKLYSDIV